MCSRFCAAALACFAISGAGAAGGHARAQALFSPSDTWNSAANASRSDANFASTCKLYPGKRIVMVSVSEEYLDMFRNWLHFSSKFLGETEQLVAIAEDVAVEDRLRRLANVTGDGHPALVPRFQVSRSSGAEALGADQNRNLTALRGSLEESAVGDAPHFASQGFGDLVTQRSNHILAYLNQGCTVLYSDIDNVWVKDPFQEIARFPHADILAPDDEPANVSSGMYLCTCFIYVQPSDATKGLMTAWGERAAGQSTNQRPFNAVLQEARGAGRLTAAVLPGAEFPPGNVASEYPNATVFHANWVSGLPKKVEFLNDRGLWSVTGPVEEEWEQEEEEQALPVKILMWAEGIAKLVVARVHGL